MSKYQALIRCTEAISPQRHKDPEVFIVFTYVVGDFCRRSSGRVPASTHEHLRRKQIINCVSPCFCGENTLSHIIPVCDGCLPSRPQRWQGMYILGNIYVEKMRSPPGQRSPTLAVSCAGSNAILTPSLPHQRS